jgi:RNA polymerase sigma-70 factor (ECF subfamily)
MSVAALTPTADFNAIVNEYWRDLFLYAYRLCGNRHTAEDLVQESLARAWTSFDKLRSTAAVKSWLYTIVRRENARRFERLRPLDSAIPAEEIDAGQTSYDTSAEAFILRRALRDLPAEYREPLLLQVLHGYSQREIADRLGMSPAGVGTRLFRARQKLRTALGRR